MGDRLRGFSQWVQLCTCTDKKEIQTFLKHNEIQKGSVAKLYWTIRLLIHIWLNIYALSHLLGSPSSNMTLQPIPSEFTYIWGKILFLFYQCGAQINFGDLTPYLTYVFKYIRIKTVKPMSFTYIQLRYWIPKLITNILQPVHAVRQIS